MWGERTESKQVISKLLLQTKPSMKIPPLLCYDIHLKIKQKLRQKIFSKRRMKNLYPFMHFSEEKYDAKESVSNSDIESIFHLRTSTTVGKQS